MTANITTDLPQPAAEEDVRILATGETSRIERIVSHGHASPEGFWYEQEMAEWVMVVSGSAGLQFEDEAEPRVLKAGDYVDIPAHRRHRLAWTDAKVPTVRLVVHYR